MFIDFPIPPVYKKILKFKTLTNTSTDTIKTLNFFTGSQPKILLHARLFNAGSNASWNDG